MNCMNLKARFFLIPFYIAKILLNTLASIAHAQLLKQSYCMGSKKQDIVYHDNIRASDKRLLYLYNRFIIPNL